MSDRTSAAVDAFWDYVAFLLNSAVFLLIGLSLPPKRRSLQGTDHPWRGCGGPVCARAVAVYGIFGGLRPSETTGRHPPSAPAGVGGLRGAVAVAMLLSIPGSIRAEIGDVPALVYGVVLLTLTVQGMTIGPLAARLRLQSVQTDQREHVSGRIVESTPGDTEIVTARSAGLGGTTTPPNEPLASRSPGAEQRSRIMRGLFPHENSHWLPRFSASLTVRRNRRDGAVGGLAGPGDRGDAGGPVDDSGAEPGSGDRGGVRSSSRLVGPGCGCGILRMRGSGMGDFLVPPSGRPGTNPRGVGPDESRSTRPRCRCCGRGSGGVRDGP